MKKGKLKIFFGYVAGVGKTYAMLKEAHKLKDEGVDVIIGYFEPHDRKDTMALTEGLEQLPLKEFEYRGITLKEFDVDKAIIRNPEYILVDELAHTNVKGSKNRKRYLDVIELLNHGINVYTTLNVQHIESLNDIIDSKTSVNVNERIPDEIFELADEISIIDLDPPAIIERMKAGKIYKKEKIDLALENFFKVDNLSLLRELTMRRMADKIEIEKNNGIKPIKFLVLISPSPSSSKNIRVTARMAANNHAKFTALYVETNTDLSNESARQLKNHIDLVRDLGGELIIKYANDVIEAIVDYVRVSGVTNLIVGKTWESIGKKVPFENKLISELPDIEVLIVTDHQSVSKRRRKLCDYFKGLCGGGRLEKYRHANKALDIIKTINQEVEINDKRKTYQGITKILARSFERGVLLRIKKDSYLCSFNNIDINFFDEVVENEAINWAYQNGVVSGRGSNTLRNAKAIYFPIFFKGEVVAVLGLSTINEKLNVTDKLLFYQIASTLALNIAFLERLK